MFTLIKKFTFEASHLLPLHDGKCRRLHGHSWRGEVIVSGPELNREGSKSGMLIDFADLSAAVRELVDARLDHYHLNESIPEIKNPTSEELARWIFMQLAPKLRDLAAVRIHETCTSECEYRP